MKRLQLLAIIEAGSITGPAKNLLEFARRAPALDVFTTILTFVRGEPENQFTRAVRAAGIPLETVAESGPFDPAALRSLRAIAARVRPDLIQTHAVKSHFLTRAAGLSREWPWIAFHHGYTWPTLKARGYNQLDRWSLRSADKVLTVSEPFRQELTAFGIPARQIEIIHNAIPGDWGAAARGAEQAANLRSAMKIPDGRKIILIVGRLSREKDHVTLLEAVSRLPSSMTPHVVIIGEGHEKPRVEERMRQLGLQENVTFTGHQPSAEPWYGIADIAVLSSLSEGSPNALLEAMATSVPVVATNVGGVPEIVRDEESALLVAPGDAAAMSDALLRILSDAGLADRLAKRGRALIQERHDPDARVRRLVSIYRSLAGAENPPA
jgi:glycosyltransferase involved in cell wall biosynthesis